MRAKLNHTVIALALLAPVAYSVPAAAQTTVTRTPAVSALQLSADSGLAPGSQLQFTVRGTPRARTSVRINDSNIIVPLRETSAGVYQGTHTVRASDRIDANGLLRASVTSGQYTSTTNYTFPASFVAWAANNNPQQPPQQQQAAAPRIDRFSALADGALEPGSQVRFMLNGVAGGSAVMNIPGVARNIALEEQRPGVYRGSYTVRRQDNTAGFSSAAATLKVGNQSVSSNLTEPLEARGGPPPTNSMGAAPMTALQPTITSHTNNGTVDASTTEVRGRTAPNATVRVRVDAVPPVIGQRLGVAQQLVSETVQADANGNFSFNFQPRFPIPGTRYELSMTANSGSQSAESKLTLSQRG